MAKNPFLADYKNFCRWIETTPGMPDELREAALRFKLALWCAAHNPEPPLGFVEELEKFERVRASVQAGAHQN